MSYSRRQLEALGEPLGESVTRKEGGRIVYGGGGGGGGGGTSTQVTDLPEWAKPTAERNLAKAESLTTDKPYQSYGNWARQEGIDPNRVAGFNRLQNTSFQNAETMTGAPQNAAATGMAMEAGQRALGTGYDAGQFQNQYQGFDPYSAGNFQNQFQSPGQYQSGQFGANQVQAQGLQNYQMGPAERVNTQSFAQPGSADAYMSPYMQSVVGAQQREATRASEMQRNQNQAQAVGQGAFGGSRQAIVEAERQRNLGTQLGDIQATGSQAAYQQAQQQFNQEQAARLQAQQANQQAGLTVGQQNLGANLGIQQLGAGQNMQAQLANQQAGMESQRMGEQSRQFGAGQGLSAAQLQAQYGLSAQQAEEASRQFSSSQAAQQAAQRAQYGQAAQQLQEQSRQYGAGLGMQGLQTALSSAGQLGQLGQQQFGQNMDINKLQNTYGAQQQANEQAKLGYNMQDYSAAQQYPYQQLSFLSNIMRGTPMGGVSTMYGAQPTAAQNVASLGMGAYGIGQLMKADGGSVYSYAEGGSVDSAQNIEAIVEKLSDPQLKQAAEAAQMRGDVEQLQIIQQEMSSRASERNGMMGAFNQLPQEQQQQMMAGGGMVAFNGDEDENDEYTGQQVRMPVGRGDEKIYGESLAGLTALQKKMAADKGYTPLSAADEKAMYDRSTSRGKEIYGDVLSKIKADIESQRGESAESLSQGRGLAALQAAAAMGKGRGFVQGLANAGGAFGESYSKALRADKEQKRALSGMELNLAKAEADQRMGLHDKAEAQVAKANASREKAYNAGVTKDRALADVMSKTGRLALPPAPTKAGGPKPLKLAEQLAEAETLHETKPSEASLARVTALRRAMDRARTSDFGPNRAGLGEASLDVRIGEAINTAQQKLKFTPEYVKADAAGKAQMMKDAAAQARANAGKNAGVNNNSPQRGGIDLQFDAQGKLLPS
jgi:hypothetical protein